MNEWLWAAIVLIAAFVPGLALCIRARATDALAAMEVVATLATTALMVLAEGYHRQPFIDLAMILGLVSLVGALAFARLMERDL
jgi:multisubunit Na+/H+ antiporter MnhF subunit